MIRAVFCVLIFAALADVASAVLGGARFVPTATVRRADFKFEAGKCAFYCFYIPEKNAKMDKDALESYFKGAARCSHLTYGFAYVDERLRIIPPTDFDFIPTEYYGNFKFISSLRKNSTGVKLLYGIRITTSHQRWIDSARLHKQMAQKLVWHTRNANLDGMFLHMDADLLFSSQLTRFFDNLGAAIAKDEQFYRKSALLVVLTVKAEWAPHVAHLLAPIERHLHAVYLWADDTMLSADDHSSSSAVSSPSSSLRGAGDSKLVPRLKSPLAAYVDPLSASSRVNAEDTIRFNAVSLAEKSTLGYSRVVVGLSAWTRSYVFEDDAIAYADAHNQRAELSRFTVPVNDTFFRRQKREEAKKEELINTTALHTAVGHGVEALRLGDAGPSTQRQDGRLAYYETCKIEGFENARVVDHLAATTSFFGGDSNHWYSFNAPVSESLGQKLKWVSQRGFGGVGLFSLQADDAHGACSPDKRTYTFPLHNFVAHHFRCRNRDPARENGLDGNNDVSDAGRRDECTRLCIIDLEANSDAPDFNFDNLQTKWCSHIVVAPIYMHGGQVVTTEAMRQLLDDFVEWPADYKPRLILSLGSAQSSAVWRNVLSNEQTRATIVENIHQTLEQLNADGVDISWTRLPLENGADANALERFASELRAKLPKSQQIFVSVSSTATLNKRYNFEQLANIADYIIIQGYKLHNVKSAFTGHHSPLFADAEIFSNPKNTIEGVTQIWRKHVEGHKLIVGLSAAPFSQSFLAKDKGMRTNRVRHEIGDRADTAVWRRVTELRNRADRKRAKVRAATTQTEVCQLLRNESTRVTFLNAIGVPYLISGDDFVAYDNSRSIQLKAVWTMMNGFGGLALHALGADNYDGECPAADAFPLLRALANAQVCSLCNKTTEELEKNTDESESEKNVDENPSRRCAENNGTKVICHYSTNALGILPPSEIPAEQCDEIVIDGAFLNGAGKIVYNDKLTSAIEMKRNDKHDKDDDKDKEEDNDENKDEDEAVDKEEKSVSKDVMSFVREWVNKGRAVIFSIACFMQDKEFEKLIASGSTKLSLLIYAHLAEFGFTGVELKCNHHIFDAKRGKAFIEFLGTLETQFSNFNLTLAEETSEDVKAEEACQKTIAMRVPVWEKNLSSKYNITRLNQLINRITIEQWPEETLPGEALTAALLIKKEKFSREEKTNKDVSALLNPLFSVPSGESTPRNFAIDDTVRSWVDSGLKRNLIVIPLPAYGIQLKRKEMQEDEEIRLILSAPPPIISRITYSELCEKVNITENSRQTILYDRVVGFTMINNDKEQLSFENKHTAAYKMRYAMRENLAGVALMTLHKDDFEGKCDSVKFPLLTALKKIAQEC